MFAVPFFLLAGWLAQAQNPQDAIRRDYESGGQAMRAGNLRAAEAAFRHVLSIAPNDAGAHGNLGVIYMRQRKWNEALAQFKIAEKLAPAVAGVRLNIGLIYFRQGEYAAAIPPFESVLRDTPDSVQARRLLGICYLVKERYADSVRVLAPIWKSENNDLSYLYVVAVAADQAGNRELVERAGARMLEVGQNSAEMHLLLGKAHLMRGEEDDQAFSELEQAAKLNPRLPFVHYNLGALHMRKRDYSKAASEFLADAAIEPDVAYNYDQLGSAHLALEQLADAERYFLLALRHDPALASSYYGLGKVYRSQKKYADELKMAAQASKLDPSSPSARYLKAHALLQLGRKEEADKELATMRKLQVVAHDKEAANIQKLQDAAHDRLSDESSGSRYRDPQLTREEK